MAQTMKACQSHAHLPAVVNLDGEDMCQECADNWVRAEGQWQAEQEQLERDHGTD